VKTDSSMASRNSLKQLTKVVVPKRVLNHAVATKDRLVLASTPQNSFDSVHLRSGVTLSPQHIFDNADVLASWKEDEPCIRNLYGDRDVMGGVNPGDRRALYYLIMVLTPRSVLEIGTHIGASTLHIALALKRLNQGGRMATVDLVDVNDPQHGPWKQLGLAKPPKEFACELRCLDRVEFCTAACLNFMKESRERYDFIFLDGDHRARAVYCEVAAALPLLANDGVILLHDYYPEGKPLYPDNGTIVGPFYALERIKKEQPSIDVLPLGLLPWPTKLGTNATSLALVVRKP
jgi:predicted O-methyltransferase YrrM